MTVYIYSTIYEKKIFSALESIQSFQLQTVNCTNHMKNFRKGTIIFQDQSRLLPGIVTSESRLYSGICVGIWKCVHIVAGVILASAATASYSCLMYTYVRACVRVCYVQPDIPAISNVSSRVSDMQCRLYVASLAVYRSLYHERERERGRTMRLISVLCAALFLI